MGVLYVEDIAGHDGPESCVGAREGGGEALTGVHAGRVSSREKLKVQGAEARDERLLQLLCRSHEQPGDQLIPLSCHMALASRASAAEPKWPDAMGANEALDRSLAAARAPETSTPRCAV